MNGTTGGAGAGAAFFFLDDDSAAAAGACGDKEEGSKDAYGKVTPCKDSNLTTFAALGLPRFLFLGAALACSL